MNSAPLNKNRLINKLDSITNYLKNVLDNEYIVWSLFAFNIFMFLLVSIHCVEIDVSKSLYFIDNVAIPGKESRTVSVRLVRADIFRLLYHSFSFYTSTIFAVFFAWIARYPTRKFEKSKNVDLGFIFIALAATTWAVSSWLIIILELYKENVFGNLRNWVSLFMGDLNTYFFLCVIPLLDFDKRPKILEKVKFIFDKRFVFILGILLFIFYIFIYIFYIQNPIIHLVFIKKISFACTLTAFLIYFVAFNKIFNERIPDFSYLFYFSSLLLLVAILTDAFVVVNEGSQSKVNLLLDITINIILFIYRPVMLLVLCALTVSHFYKTQIDEIKKIDDYRKKIESVLHQKTELLKTEEAQHEESKKNQKEALEEQRRQMNHSTKNTLSLLYTDLLELLDNNIDMGRDGKDIFMRIESRITAAQELHNELHESTIGSVLAAKKTLLRVLDKAKSVFDFKDERFKVSMDLPEDLYFETKDMRHINRFIVELLSNICIHAYPGYAPEERIISLNTHLKNGLFIIVVEDEGVGFDLENNYSKKGFGLSYIERIVKEELKGEFSSQSKIGQGSKFLIKIPTDYIHK